MTARASKQVARWGDLPPRQGLMKRMELIKKMSEIRLAR